MVNTGNNTGKEFFSFCQSVRPFPPIFNLVDPYSEYRSGSKQLLIMDPIWIQNRFQITGFHSTTVLALRSFLLFLLPGFPAYPQFPPSYPQEFFYAIQIILQFLCFYCCGYSPADAVIVCVCAVCRTACVGPPGPPAGPALLPAFSAHSPLQVGRVKNYFPIIYFLLLPVLLRLKRFYYF